MDEEVLKIGMRKTTLRRITPPLPPDDVDEYNLT